MMTHNVLQADREAAAPWAILPANSRKIRAGKMDWNPMVQAFAKHRHDSTAELLEAGDKVLALIDLLAAEVPANAPLLIAESVVNLRAALQKARALSKEGVE